MHTKFACVGAALLVSAVAAQPALHTTASPKVFTGYFAGSSNAFPLGRSGGLIQYWHRGDNFFPGQVIVANGVRPRSGLSAAGLALSIEIKLSNATVTHATFGKIFANNLGQLTTTVFARKPVNLPALGGATDPDQPVVWLASDVPFAYVGPNMVIQYDLGPATGAVSTPYSADAYTMAGPTSTLFKSSEPSCGGTVAVSYTAVAGLTMTISGATPSQPAWFLVGVDNVLLGGVPSLPFKLDPLGLTGCVLGVDPLVTVATVADGTGTATLNVPYALTTTSVTDVLHVQGLHRATGNPVGLASTNVAHCLLGGSGQTQYVYNWTVDGPSAQYGPYTSNRSAVLLFKP